MQTAIVIPAYNRPHTLARLLASLQNAEYPRGVKVPLIISIDPEKDVPNPAVRKVAESFAWGHGTKEIVLHPEHLGLLQNYYFCGNLTRTYEAAIYLEDDLVLSPVFYYFTQQAHQYFSEDERIAGVSLYAYQFNGYRHYPFHPLEDGADVYFAQIASILGQSWTKSQWDRFVQWQKSHSLTMKEALEPLHDVWQFFANDDFFPLQEGYLVSTGQFYVFPRTSLTTGFGDQGVHFELATSYFQVPLHRNQKEYRFHNLDQADAVYDSFMEILPTRLKNTAPALRGFDFDVDLNATKSLRHLKSEYVLTTRPCRNSIQTFSLAMHPAEANVIFNATGKGISLCHRSDILWDKWNDLQIGKRLHDYHAHPHLSRKQSFQYFLLNILQRIRKQI